ncbi:Glyoxylate/hydroxypyruvate reductase B [compost metagenome]
MKYRGTQIKGKTAGIIGLGHNGAAIAERCAGLGMNVVYWSRFSKSDVYRYVELDELMKTADVIFPAFAKNNETNALLTEELLANVKSSATIVDIIELDEARASILDMVKTGRLFGYGFEAKPATFSEYEGNVWAAPAYGWVTFESMYNGEMKLVENIVNAVKNDFPNRVN